MQVFHYAEADVWIVVPKEAISNSQQVTICELWAQDSSNFVQTAGECAQSLDVRHARQFEIKRSEFRPFGLSSHPDEGGEVERSVVAHVLIVSLHRCIDKEVCDTLVDCGTVFQRSDERSNVLEGGTSHDF